jgi:putative transposase
MHKTFKYRLYPTKPQARLRSEQLEELRWLWNMLLAQRKRAWEERQAAMSYDDLQNALPTMKITLRPPLAHVLSLVVQDVIRRLQKALDAFFRRLQAGENPGYPRFRGKGRSDALTSPRGTTASSSLRAANGSFSPRSGT